MSLRDPIGIALPTRSEANMFNELSIPGDTAQAATSDVADAAALSEYARDLLRATLAASKAVFRYQPQIDLQTGCVAGVESVLCIPGPQQYRPATALLAEIDAAGLSLALTEYQLWDACRKQRGWMQEFSHDFPIGVPVSRWVLGNEALLPMARRVLAESGLAPWCLELEVEESAIGVSVIARHAFASVGDAGICIAVDGFNATYANLRVLAMSPISKVRVAALPLLRSGTDTLEKMVFGGILGAARGLGISVCATGIDSSQALAAVLGYGRPLGQGRELAPMLDSAEFLGRLRNRNETTATLPVMRPGISRFARGTEISTRA